MTIINITKMCKLSEGCELFFEIIIIILSVIRYVFSIMTTIFSFSFENIPIILLILSSICTILLTIGFFHIYIAYSYGDYVHIETKDYIYTRKIDISKEDPLVQRERWNKQQHHSDVAKIFIYISLIFTIGVMEEYIRIEDSEKEEKSIYFILYIITGVTELYLTVIYKGLEYLNKK